MTKRTSERGPGLRTVFCRNAGLQTQHVNSRIIEAGILVGGVNLGRASRRARSRVFVRSGRLRGREAETGSKKVYMAQFLYGQWPEQSLGRTRHNLLLAPLSVGSLATTLDPSDKSIYPDYLGSILNLLVYSPPIYSVMTIVPLTPESSLFSPHHRFFRFFLYNKYLVLLLPPYHLPVFLRIPAV
jgi:hypothetical protein